MKVVGSAASKLGTTKRIIAQKIFDSHIRSRITEQFKLARGRISINQIATAWSNSKAVQKILSLRQHTSGNRATLFFNGSQAMQSLWSHIENAKSRVWIEIYQLTPDSVGIKTIKLLSEAASRGVHVVLLYDGVGSHTLKEHHLKDLVLANGTVIQYGSGPWDLFLGLLGGKQNISFVPPWIGRNHRKLVLVDDDVAFCGGMNIGEDYCGHEVGGNGRFYDAHCLIRGPAHHHLVNGFLRSVKNASRHEWVRLKDWVNEKKPERGLMKIGEGTFVQVLDSDITHNIRNIQKALIYQFNHAESTIDIMSPYFLPPPPLQKAMISASKRGVQIRLITQGICKTPIINSASQHVYGKFLECGVEVYEMRDQELHAKVMVVDGVVCSIGTFNFDILSFEVNSELNISMWDPELSFKTISKIDSDILTCKKVTHQEWTSRAWYLKIFHWICYIACRLVFLDGKLKITAKPKN